MNGLQPNGNMPVSRAGDNAPESSSDDSIVVVGAFNFVFEEGLEEYVEIFSDLVSGGYYDDILVGAGGGETIMVSAGKHSKCHRYEIQRTKRNTDHRCRSDSRRRRQ